MRTQAGFSLIELMVVVAIIAILAAIALPAFQDYTAKADVINAVAGVAGEKIKVADNYENGAVAGQSAICTGTATGTCRSSDAQLRNTSTSGRSVITLSPTFGTGGDRVTWVCDVVASIGSRIANDCTNGVAVN